MLSAGVRLTCPVSSERLHVPPWLIDLSGAAAAAGVRLQVLPDLLHDKKSSTVKRCPVLLVCPLLA
jgi:hypothetical protein